MISGPPVQRFQNGWALPMFSWSVAHFYRREGVALAVPLCGAPAKAAGLLLEAGAFQHCKRCSKLVVQEPSTP